jgi:putative hemolysin
VLPDGRLASGSDDDTIRLWDVTTGAQTIFKGHSHGVNALCVLPDGRLASGSNHHTIRLWDVTTGAETARLEGHADSVNALCVLPDGRLVSGSDDCTIRLWDVTTGAETALEGHSDGVNALCMLPDGRLASGSNDCTIRLWDVITGAETARLEADAPLFCLTAAADLHVIVGDTLGHLHWLEVLIRSESTHDTGRYHVRWEAEKGAGRTGGTRPTRGPGNRAARVLVARIDGYWPPVQRGCRQPLKRPLTQLSEIGRNRIA